MPHENREMGHFELVAGIVVVFIVPVPLIAGSLVEPCHVAGQTRLFDDNHCQKCPMPHENGEMGNLLGRLIDVVLLMFTF